MDKLHYKNKLSAGASNYMVRLSLIVFKEDLITIIYSPALDLSGYGRSMKEAQYSFETTLEEFLRYTVNKNTFESELIRMGWKTSGKKSRREFKQPFLDELLKSNQYLSDIVRDKEFTRIHQEVSFPVYA